ncbi:GNAT family N-acetyltransferase [Catenovulum sp. SM1970]|nr:GNAT family N-acetyltransferase [Marinifaba aquimaris]
MLAPSSQAENYKACFLTPEQFNVAASILYQAYHDDPFFQTCFKSETKRYEQKLRAAIRAELNVFWDTNQPIIGIFDDSEQLQAVACITTPESNLGPERFWHWRLNMMLTAGYVSTKQMIEKERRVKAALTGKGHYHQLSFIAVKPQKQHLGIGQYLMKALDGHIQSNEDSTGMAVLVTEEKYTAFFSADNYSLVDTIFVGDIKASLMFRQKAV